MTLPHHRQLEVLELLTAAPPQTDLSAEQRAAVAVLSDWSASQGNPYGTWVAERSRAPVAEARSTALGVHPWQADVDLRFHAVQLLELDALVPAVAEGGDLGLAVRVLAWLGTHRAGAPLHQPVAAHITGFLTAVERRELAVVSYRDWKFQVANGWQLDVFVRGHEFWRIDYAIDPRGFTLNLVDYDDGPLAVVNDYEPPSEVAEQVYRIGPPWGVRPW